MLYSKLSLRLAKKLSGLKHLILNLVDQQFRLGSTGWLWSQLLSAVCVNEIDKLLAEAIGAVGPYISFMLQQANLDLFTWQLQDSM